jgi:hypothetical protein
VNNHWIFARPELRFAISTLSLAQIRRSGHIARSISITISTTFSQMRIMPVFQIQLYRALKQADRIGELQSTEGPQRSSRRRTLEQDLVFETTPMFAPLR